MSRHRRCARGSASSAPSTPSRSRGRRSIIASSISRSSFSRWASSILDSFWARGSCSHGSPRGVMKANLLAYTPPKSTVPASQAPTGAVGNAGACCGLGTRPGRGPANKRRASRRPADSSGRARSGPYPLVGDHRDRPGGHPPEHGSGCPRPPGLCQEELGLPCDREDARTGSDHEPTTTYNDHGYLDRSGRYMARPVRPRSAILARQ